MVWMIFIKTLKNTIQASNKTLNLTVTELFLIGRKNNKSRDKQQNAILTKKQQKYQRYYLQKSINMNILQVNKYYLLNKEE